MDRKNVLNNIIELNEELRRLGNNECTSDELQSC